jgi:hypothetical protein
MAVFFGAAGTTLWLAEARRQPQEGLAAVGEHITPTDRAGLEAVLRGEAE